jgi:hypothetical protein
MLMQRGRDCLHVSTLRLDSDQHTVRGTIHQGKALAQTETMNDAKNSACETF